MQALPDSELEVDELPAAELADEHDRIEACRVEHASDIPRRAGDDVQVAGGVLHELHEPERDDQSATGTRYDASGIAGRLTIALSIPAACSIDSARKNSQPRQTR